MVSYGHQLPHILILIINSSIQHLILFFGRYEILDYQQPLWWNWIWNSCSATLGKKYNFGTNQRAYFIFRSLVSSFWVCSNSWRSWEWTSWRSRVSAVTAWSLAKSWMTDIRLRVKNQLLPRLPSQSAGQNSKVPGIAINKKNTHLFKSLCFDFDLLLKWREGLHGFERLFLLVVERLLHFSFLALQDKHTNLKCDQA